MYSALKLELIGDDRAAVFRAMGLRYSGTRPWVARVTWVNERIQREFLRGMTDYRHANSVGSRGVYLHFTLSEGMYEVLERVTWKRSDRYFLLVEEAGKQTRKTKEEAIRWMQDVDLVVPY